MESLLLVLGRGGGSGGVGTAPDNGINVMSVFFTPLVYMRVCACVCACTRNIPAS